MEFLSGYTHLISIHFIGQQLVDYATDTCYLKKEVLEIIHK